MNILFYPDMRMYIWNSKLAYCEKWVSEIEENE